MSLRIGDMVTVKVPTENREWGYNPCPDDTVVEIVGFGDICYNLVYNFGLKPGRYINDSWAKIKLPDEKIISISSSMLTMIEKVERSHMTNEERYLGPLPDTDFVEEDEIEFDNRKYIIGKVNYHYIGEVRTDGSPMPMYDITEGENCGHLIGRDHRKFKLISRGNVWKYYHGEKLSFDGIESKAKFFSSLGHTDEIKNPKTGYYTFNLEEALDALKTGIGHSINVSGGFFGGAPSTHVYRFRDEELGKEVAALTLKGFPETK